MSPKILIVDDLPFNVALMEHILRAEGFRTCSAVDGPSALAICKEEKPDLILLDVMMPGENGFETCARLKSGPVTADIPIIFLSVLDEAKDKVKGLKTGGVDYISKPVNGEELLARVRIHLRISENNRAMVREQQLRLEELRSAQQAILVKPEDCPDARFAVCYKPLEGAGGDFYDVIAVDSEVFGYFVADVSGHGASAAFLTSAIKALLRQYTGPLFSPEDTMRGVDSVMRQMLGEEQYLTACYALLNRRTRKLSVVSAGHPPLVVVSRTGEAQVVEMDSAPLGMFSALVLYHKDLTVAPGSRLYMYTDGFIEASPGEGRREGIARLVEACIGHRTESLPEAVASIAKDLVSAGVSVNDDLLLLGTELMC